MILDEDLKTPHDDDNSKTSPAAAPSQEVGPPAYAAGPAGASSSAGRHPTTAAAGDDLPPQIDSFDPSFSTDSKRAPPSSIPLPSATDLPALLPPLYPPSKSSPFLVAFPPALESTVPKPSFLAFLHALNEAIAPSAWEQTDRVIRAVPVVNVGYGIVKSLVVGIGLGLAKGAARAVEGSDGQVTQRISKVHQALYGRSSLPKKALALLSSVNSPTGLFPPSSSLQLLLVPYASLPSVLANYTTLEVYPSQATESIQTWALAEGKNEERKVVKVRRRIDYRKWAWLEVGLDDAQPPTPSELSPVSSSSLTDSPISPTASSSTPSTANRVISNQRQTGLLPHLDQKLSAHSSRRRSKAREPYGKGVYGVEPGAVGVGVGGKAGYEIDQAMNGLDEVLFIVVCKRDVNVL